MRSMHLTLALGLAGLLTGAGACSDPVTLPAGRAPGEPSRILDVVVHNHTGGPLELALESAHATIELGLMDSRLEGRFEVDVRELGGAGVGRLVATDGGPWVMRSDPVWLEGGRAVDFTITSGGIVWR
jgi:hypothetical protein